MTVPGFELISTARAMSGTPLDLARLVEIITGEVIATLGRSGAGVQCACHGVLQDCCPSRVRGLIDAGATRLGLHAGGGRPGEVSGLIDHTLLKPDATLAEIEALCREAAEFRFATVCVRALLRPFELWSSSVFHRWPC